MRTTLLGSIALVASAAAMPLAAQVTVRATPRAYAYSISTTDSPRAVIGVTLSTGDAQDTLGLRISDVTAESPAAKAGIQEGDRLQSINGINLRLSSIDIGDQQMADAMANRLTRELGKLKAGDNVSLKVYHDGSVKTVSVKTVDSGDLYNTMGTFMKRADNRAVLGVSLAVTGSKRDTLGVLIIGVNDDGPASKAGLEEGNRIAAINGVDLKVDRADAGDSYVSNARYQRLQKEMEKAKPGDNVTLQVYADGRFKSVQLKTTRASDLAGASSTFMFNGGVPGGMMTMNLDGQKIREEVQGAMDQVRKSMNEVRIAPRVRWMSEDGAPAATPAPAVAAVEPAMRLRGVLAPAEAMEVRGALASAEAMKVRGMLAPARITVSGTRLIRF